MTDAKLKSLVERAEKIIEERGAVSEDLKDIFAEAKSAGYDVRTMRAIIKERDMDAADVAEREALLETYRAALGMAVELVNGGVSLRKAAKAAGISKSSVHRALAVPAVSPPHDSETGEITEQPAAGVPAAPVISNGDGSKSCGGGESRPAGSEEQYADEQNQGSQPNPGPRAWVKAPPAGVAPGPQDTRTFDEIVGPIPPFLDRRPDSAKRLNVTETV